MKLHELAIEVDGRQVPVAIWKPFDAPGQRPLVLVGHGGSGHKTSQLVLDIAGRLVAEHGFIVAAIDGPVHGSRRALFEHGPKVLDEFRELWARGDSVDAMVDDWRATLDALCAMPEVDPSAIGWYGISMGTAYGLPLVAAEPRILAAVLGMWGTDRKPRERLERDAARVRVPVLFQQKADDAIFSDAGQRDLFTRLASIDREHIIYAGGHTDPAGEQLDDIVDFFVTRLKARPLPASPR
jgi:dienelactone hydrolase